MPFIKSTALPITIVKVQKIALVIIGIISLAVCTTAAAILAPQNVKLLAPLLIGLHATLFPMFAILIALKIRDYEDPAEVALMREQAISMDYKQLIKFHGTIQKVLKAGILFPQEALDKLQSAVQEENLTIKIYEEKIGFPLFVDHPKVKMAYQVLLQLEKDQQTILSKKLALEQNLDFLEQLWI